MSAVRWTEQETIKLIDLYKIYSFLWDWNHKLYKNGKARCFAYLDILKKMEKPNLTVRDIRCKIKNLRSAYYQEEKKRITIESKGKDFVSSLAWFNNFREVMDVIQDIKPEDIQVEEEVEVSENEGGENMAPQNMIEPMLFSDDTIIVSIKQEFLDEMEKKESNKYSVRCSDKVSEYLDLLPAAKKKKKTTKKESKPETEPIDEFQLFSNNMAEQLRHMPLDKALNLQLEVQALIAKTRIDIFSKKGSNNPNENDNDDDDMEQQVVGFLQ